MEQTGIVGLFEICFEQAWKLMKAVLENHGRVDAATGAPRKILKTAYQSGMIKNSDGWLELLDARNTLAHTYSDDEALRVIEKVKTDYFPLFAELQTELDENWL